MRTKLLSIVCLFSMLAFVPAQQKKPSITAYTGPEPDPRASTRVFYWDEANNTTTGQVVINYGRPDWKPEYDDAAKFDGFTKGKVWRMGKDFWTVLDTNLPLTIGGKPVAPGSYYLGLHRSADGNTWSLAFVDPAKARKKQLDAFQIEQAPVEFQIPMKLEKAAAANQKFTVLLSASKERPESVTLNVSWGKLRLSVPVHVKLAG